MSVGVCAVICIAASLSGCAGGGAAIQPDRTVFTLDGNYQRFEYPFGIEEAFDRTVKVFHDSGYRMDVADRATGQISGERAGGVSGNSSDKGLKFYALILPSASGGSQVAARIMQVIKHDSVVSSTKTELIVSDVQMYQYLFRRIGSISMGVNAGEAPPAGSLPAAAEPVRGPK